MVKFAEYVHSLAVPSNLNLVRIKPLRGTALVVLEPRLVFTVIDNFFGGDGRFHARIEGRRFHRHREPRHPDHAGRAVHRDERSVVAGAGDWSSNT